MGGGKKYNSIDLLRFPLAILVVFIHNHPDQLIATCNPKILSQHLLQLGVRAFSSFTGIAVPTFFMISGFLFFLNLTEWSWGVYRTKLKKRAKTLLIPYLIWNCYTFFLDLLPLILHDARNGSSYCIDFMCKNWAFLYDSYSGYPWDFPLWFLRDLMIISLLTPLIYYAIKRLKLFFPLALFLAYIMHWWPSIPGFSIECVLFFSLGAWFTLNKRDMVVDIYQFKYSTITISLVLLVLDVIHIDPIAAPIHSLFVFSGVLTTFVMAQICVEQLNMIPNKFLVSTCFFIYAAHAAYLFPFIRGPLSMSDSIIYYAFGDCGILGECIRYFFAPILAVAICIVIYAVIRKIFPKLLPYIAGAR